MNEPVKYPIGIQDFGEVIKGGYVYVDKTALMRRLIAGGKYYFLSRPRRFGKSLLLSTIAAYFEGRRELFEGLAIAETTDEWAEHPVLCLDLGGMTYRKPGDLSEQLDWHLRSWETRYGITEPSHSAPLRFASIILKACEVTGRQVVILIDEYDKPLLEAMDNEALREEYRAILRGVYGNLKTCDRHIKFAMLTGVTKFGKLSLFSDLNNLNDISMDGEYAELCGITERELDVYFTSGLEALADKNRISVDEAKRQLKRRYDGYLFEETAEHVYNPFSLLKTLSKKKFNDYWFETGMPDFLAEMVKRENISLESLTTDAVSAASLTALDSLSSNALPILYQSGYLTLAGLNPRSGNYFLKFPNEEVERGFLHQLLPLYAHKKNVQTDVLLDRLIAALDAGRPESLMDKLQALLADIPYERGKPGEIYFRNLLFTIFRLVGFYCEVEHPVSAGRSDVVIKTDGFIYVLELKVDESAEAALQQIEDKGYAAPYAADKRKVFKIGVNFSGKSKQIDEWQVVEA